MSVLLSKAKTKKIKYDKKLKEIKTASHDTELVQDLSHKQIIFKKYNK